MSTTAEAAADTGGQLVIDGLPVAQRQTGVQGNVTIPERLYDELALGTRLRAVIELDVVSRTDRKKRNNFGDDEAHRVLGLSIHAVRNLKVIPVEEDTPPMASVDGEGEPEPPKPITGSKAAQRRDREAKLAEAPKPAEDPAAVE